MQGIFQKENTDKALKYGIYRHLPTYEKIIRNLVSFLDNNEAVFLIADYFIKKKNKKDYIKKFDVANNWEPFDKLSRAHLITLN